MGDKISLIKCCNYSVVVFLVLRPDIRCEYACEVKNLNLCPNYKEAEKIFFFFLNEELALSDKFFN